eukprot:m.118274 g.118274  ORF g.118274 m.118274 type:complete len:115 (-) comp17200_c0_seq7:369-713(-)
MFLKDPLTSADISKALSDSPSFVYSGRANYSELSNIILASSRYFGESIRRAHTTRFYRSVLSLGTPTLPLAHTTPTPLARTAIHFRRFGSELMHWVSSLDCQITPRIEQSILLQ